MNRKLLLLCLVSPIIVLTFIACNSIGGKQVDEKELWDAYKLSLKDKNNLKAMDMLKEIISQNPNNSIALNNLAIDYIMNKNLDEARTYLQRAKEHAKEYSMSDETRIIALSSMSGGLKPYYILYPGENSEDTIKAIEYNLSMLTE